MDNQSILAEMLENPTLRQEYIDFLNTDDFDGIDRDIAIALIKAHAIDPDFEGVAPVCEQLRGNQPAMARAMELVMTQMKKTNQ